VCGRLDDNVVTAVKCGNIVLQNSRNPNPEKKKKKKKKTMSIEEAPRSQSVPLVAPIVLPPQPVFPPSSELRHLMSVKPDQRPQDDRYHGYSHVARGASRHFQRDALYHHLESEVRTTEEIERRAIDNKGEPMWIDGVTNKPLPPALTRLWRVMDPGRYGRDDPARYKPPPGAYNPRVHHPQKMDKHRMGVRKAEHSRLHARSLRHDFNMGTPSDRPRYGSVPSTVLFCLLPATALTSI
jgi:hypothetical protein